MNVIDRLYTEGKAAWRNGKPISENPYKNWLNPLDDSVLAIAWENGWNAAQEKARFEQPTYWSTHDATNETQETR